MYKCYDKAKQNIINLCLLCLSSVFLDFYSVVRMKILLWMNWQKLDDCFNVNQIGLLSFLFILICIRKNTPFITMYIFTFKPKFLIKRFTRGCVV